MTRSNSRAHHRPANASGTAATKPKPNCARCNDDGLYTVLPHGNPFMLDIFTLARRLEARLCTCVVGRALAEYRDFGASKPAPPARP